MNTIAKLFAIATAEEQAEWLNVAGRMLRRVCDAGIYCDLQLSRIADLLDQDGEWLVLRLASFTKDGDL